MSKQVDERVVTMEFDNKKFEENVKTSMSTIDKLKKALKFEDASEGLKEVKNAVGSNKINITGLAGAIDSVNAKFSALQVIGVTALTNITNQAIATSKKFVSALTINPVKDGLKEYETQMNAVQTIWANTQKEGTNVKIVNKALDELNTYADKTIYNFTEMTRNIGTFTAAGVKLNTSVSSIKGIANLAAISGSNAQQASTAMYQLSQAIASGTVKLMDWNSVVNAGMGGQVFQDALTRTSEHLQTGAKAAIKANGSFRESLSTGWLTTEVLTQTLDQFATAADTQAEYEAAVKKFVSQGYSKEEAKQLADMAKTAGEAATKVKTFTQLIDTLKEALGSGWTTTWRLIIGDFEEAREMWTNVSDVLSGFVNAMSDARNAVLESAMGKGIAGLSDKINAIVEPFQKAASTVTKTADAVSDLGDVVDNVILGKFGNGAERVKALTEAGQNYYRIQNRVNEKLNNSFRFTEKQVEEQDKLLGVNIKATETTKEETKETDKLADSKKELIKQFANMSDAQLRSMGLGASEIAAFKELRNMSDMLGMSLDDVIDNMDHLNGRWLLMQSLANIGNNIITVFKSIGQAWKEVFPPVTADGLFSLLAGFYKLTNSMKITDEEADKLKRTFKGLFAILDLVRVITGGGLKLALKAASYILSLFNLTLLDVTATIGDALVKFHDWVTGNNLVTRAIKALTPYIKEFIKFIVSGLVTFKDWVVQNEKITAGFHKIISILQDAGDAFIKWVDGAKEAKNIPLYIIQGLVNGLKGGISTVVSVAATFASSIIQTVCSVLGIHSPSVEFYKIGRFIIDGFVNGITSGVKKVWDALRSIGEAIIGIGKEIDYKYLGISTTALGLLIVLNKFANTIEDVKDKVFGSIAGIFNSISSLISSFAKRNKAKALKDQAKALLLLAVSIAALGASVYLLSKIPTKQLIKGGIAVAALVGILIGLTVAMSKLDKLGADTAKVSIMLIGVSVALLAMGKVATEIGSLKWEDIAKGIVFVGALTVFIVGLIAISKLSGENAKQAGKMIMKIASALLIMVLVAKLAGNLKTNEIKKGLAFIGIMGIFILALNDMAMIAGENADRAGKMMKRIASALLIMVLVAKLAGNLSPGELLQGISFIIVMETFVMLLIIVSALAGANASKAGSMMLKISVSLMIMAKVVKMVGALKPEELQKGLTFIKTLEKFIISLVAVSLIAGKNAGKAGVMLFGVALAMGSMAYVIKMVKDLNAEQLTKGLAVIHVFGALVIALVAVSKLAGKDAAKAGNMIMKVSMSLLVMTAALYLLGELSKDSKKLKSALGIVVILEALFGGLIAVTYLAKDCTKTLISVVACIVLMVSALALLTTLKTDKLIVSAKSLSIVMVAMSALIASTGAIKNTDGTMKVLLQLSLVVLLLVGILGVIQTLNIEGNINAVASISALLLAMSASLVILGNVKGSLSNNIVGTMALLGIVVAELAGVLGIIQTLNIEGNINAVTSISVLLLAMSASLLILGNIKGTVSLKAVGAMALMGLIVAELAGILFVIQKLNIKPSIATVTALSIMMMSMSEALAIIAVVGTFCPGAMSGIGALFALITGMGLLMTGLGALNAQCNGELTTFVNDSIPILQNFGEGIGNFIGGFVGGIVAGAIDSLAGIGTSLSTFMNNLQPFITSVSAIDPSSMEGGVALAEMITALVGAKLLDGLSKLLGQKDMGSLGEQLESFGTSIVAFADTLADAKIDDAKIKAAAKAGELMAELQKNLYGSGGLKQSIFGEKDLGSFGEQMGNFATGVKNFVTNLGDTKINQDQVEAAGKAGEVMAKLQSSLYGSGGVVQDLFGEKSLGNFGTQMSSFADGVIAFDSKMRDHGGIDPKSVDDAAYAGDTMANLQNSIKPIGGVIKFFSGTTDLTTFGDQIVAYGSAVIEFSDLITNSSLSSTSVELAAKCGDMMAELQRGIPENKAFDGKVSLKTFGKQIKSFGKSLKGFSDKVSGIDESAVSTAARAARNMGEMVANISTADQSKLKNFDLTGLGTEIKSFCDSFNDIQSDKVETAMDSLNDLIYMIKSMNGLQASGVNTFKGILNSLSGDTVNLKGIANTYSKDNASTFASIGSSIASAVASGIKQGANSSSGTFASIGTTMLNAIVNSFNYNMKQFEVIGGSVITNFISGVNDKKSSATSTFTTMVSTIASNMRGYHKSFFAIGKYLVDGFAAGISIETYRSTAKARQMAKDAHDAAKNELDVNSPSKKFRKLGYCVPEGFAQGIDRRSYMGVASAREMAENAIDTTKQTISRLGNMLAMDVDAQPTIRPVMDLSEVSSGVATMNGMFAMSPSIGVQSNLGSISTSMDKRQNGMNDVSLALNNLAKSISNGNAGGNTYNINGVTYDDGSNVSNAVEDLISAVLIERRM